LNNGSNLPQKNIRRGGYVAAIVGLCMLPWNLLKSSNSFTSYLSAYSVFLSSIAGVMVCVHITSELVNQGSYYFPRLPNTMLLDEATTMLQICMTLTRVVGIGTLTGSTSARMLLIFRAFSLTLSVLLVPVRPLQQDERNNSTTDFPL